MSKANVEVTFPGQKTGIIRVFIKRIKQESSAQLHFHFDDEEFMEICMIDEHTVLANTKGAIGR